MSAARILVAGDEPALERFLARHADSSMFLRSNARAVGVVDRGELFHGTYAAAFAGDEIVGVACHSWTGSVLLQAPAELAEVVRTAVTHSGRAVSALIGPLAQVRAARDALGILVDDDEPDAELLLALDLERLQVPAMLAAGEVECRPTSDDDLELATRWNAEYAVEILGDVPGPALDSRVANAIANLHELGRSWVLWSGDVPVAYAAFNAALPDVVQLGGVYTPPGHRDRGYARAVVAGALRDARAAGVARAVLFTGAENLAAQRAYVALGFAHVGDYGLLFVRA